MWGGTLSIEGSSIKRPQTITTQQLRISDKLGQPGAQRIKPSQCVISDLFFYYTYLVGPVVVYLIQQSSNYHHYVLTPTKA